MPALLRHLFRALRPQPDLDQAADRSKADKLNTATDPSFVLPTGILMEDACIIDEQENHVVLTVRVPLDLIRDNHAMLMALSEIATGRPLPSLIFSARPSP
jgi:hypothetical protein